MYDLDKPFHVLKGVDEKLAKKALILHYMGTKADLARKMKVDPKAVRRILDPGHNSKTATLKKALDVLGVSTTIAYDTEPFQMHVAWRQSPHFVIRPK